MPICYCLWEEVNTAHFGLVVLFVVAGGSERSIMLDDESTPARNISKNRGNKRPATGSPSPSSPLSNEDEMRSIIQRIIKEEFSGMLTQFNESMARTIHKELETIRTEMKDMIGSMAFINEKFEDFERNQLASNEKIKKLETENTELKMEIGNLHVRMNNLEQHSRANNLEIQCMPEAKNENVVTIVSQLGRVVNCNIQEEDILHCTRIAKSNPSSTRPRSIVVQLSSPRLRDQLLASVTKFNRSNPQDKLNCGHFGYSGRKCPVFVAEHLSPTNKSLHAATRKKAKEMDYRYVWVRNGKIFTRKSEGTEYILIKNINSLNKII